MLIIFYILGAIIVAPPLWPSRAATSCTPSFTWWARFSATALLFYLLGAPFLAVLEVVIYAGAIMVLFLFIVMMLEIKAGGADPGRVSAAMVAGLAALAGIIFMRHVPASFSWSPGSQGPLPLAWSSPWSSAGFSFRNTGWAWRLRLSSCSWPWWGRLYLGRSNGKPEG